MRKQQLCFLALSVGLFCASAAASLLMAALPVLDTGAGAAPVSYSNATLNGNLTAGGTSTVSVYWGQNTNAWSGTNSLGSLSNGVFSTPVSGLSSGALYYYRCYGTNGEGEGWSDTAAFTTRVESVAKSYGGSYDGYDQNLAQPLLGWPQVNNAGGATNITASGAWLNGTLLATGSAPTVVYVYWGTNDGTTNKASWGATNRFDGYLEDQTLSTNVNLNSNTCYYYRFYATNAAGEEGWASASTNFLTVGIPVLDTGVGAAPVSYSNATLNGNLTAGGTSTVTVYWGPNTNAWSGTNSLGPRGHGAFYTAVSGLSSGTVYYYRCYGTNAYGEGRADTAFTTRVELAATFRGGSYDGYDQYGAPSRLSVPGTVFYVK